jgi:hypothetical protein
MEAAAAGGAAAQSGGYRVKFRRDEFLDLVRNAKPRRIYHRGKNHFFSFDGFVMYCQECTSDDFGVSVVETIELSNERWQT